MMEQQFLYHEKELTKNLCNYGIFFKGLLQKNWYWRMLDCTRSN